MSSGSAVATPLASCPPPALCWGLAREPQGGFSGSCSRYRSACLVPTPHSPTAQPQQAAQGWRAPSPRALRGLLSGSPTLLSCRHWGSPSFRSSQWGWALRDPEGSIPAASATISQMEKLRHRATCPRTPGGSRAVSRTWVGSSHRADYRLASVSSSLAVPRGEGCRAAP